MYQGLVLGGFSIKTLVFDSPCTFVTVMQFPITAEKHLNFTLLFHNYQNNNLKYNRYKFDQYPYNGFMLHGKNAIEVTNCEAEGDSLSLSFS